MHKQSAQLRAKDSRMELMVLSVEHIRAFGLESDVLPAHTALLAAVVARFELGGDRCASMPQPCQLAVRGSPLQSRAPFGTCLGCLSLTGEWFTLQSLAPFGMWLGCLGSYR